ncbi:MAG: C39 family peptidase [Acidobacteriota bacterium]|nr:C39 family peptidase [Acidobacteriota bacterium]
MPRRAAPALVALAAFIAVLACAAQPALWIDVPFVAQSPEGCGSASIAMVMKYWSKKDAQPGPPDVRKIQAQLYSPKLGGISTSALEDSFRQSGYSVFAFQGTWDDLAHHIQLGRPLIVGLQASGPLGPLHYVVVVGIDSARGFPFVNDPAQRKMQRLSRQGFESEWSHTRNWTLLALPPLRR